MPSVSVTMAMVLKPWFLRKLLSATRRSWAKPAIIVESLGTRCRVSGVGVPSLAPGTRHLLIPQRHHRIDPGRATGRDDAGHHTHEQEQRRDPAQGERVGRRHAAP